MNRKVLLVCLPVLGAALVAGSGFSAWTFTESVTPAAIAGTVTVDGDATDATLSTKIFYKSGENAYTALPESLTVNLAQGDDGSDLAKGITVKAGTVEISTIRFEVTSADADLFNVYSNVKLTFALAFANGDTVATYATPATALSTVNGITAQDVTGLKSSTIGSGSSTVLYDSGDISFAWSYVEGQKPTDAAKVSAMASAITANNDFTLTLTPSATWTEKTAS